MINTCKKCYSGNYARTQLKMDDSMIQKADRLIAQAINILPKLYKAGDDHDYDKAYTSKHWNYAGGSGCICPAADSIISDIYLDCKPYLVQGLFESP